MKTSGIYLIRNERTGKVYVGQSTNIHRRRQSHVRLLSRGVHHCAPLQYSWNKYGGEVFSFIVFCQAASEKLNDYEIWAFGLIPPHWRYNVGAPGASMQGRKHSEETKAQMALSRKGRTVPEDVRAKIRETLLGHVVAEDTRSKIRAAKRGSSLSEATKKAMRKAQQNRTEAHQKAIAEGHRGLKRSPETKKRIADAIREHWSKRRASQEHQNSAH
jgi:group I intron endonuclease